MTTTTGVRGQGPGGDRPARGTAVVVGASSLIGTAVARTLLGAGWAVQAWGRDPAVLAERLPGCVPRRVDVTRREDVEDALGRVDGPLTALVYAAGVFDWADCDEADPGTWDEVFEVNLTAAARTVRLAAPCSCGTHPLPSSCWGRRRRTGPSRTTRPTWRASTAWRGWPTRPARSSGRGGWP